MAKKKKAKVKNGRPSKYSPKYIRTVEKYISEISPTANTLPKIVDIAIIIGVPEKTLHAWANENEEFRKSLDNIKDEQRKMLIDRGLFDKDVNSTITKLMLMSNHGMREKSDTDITTDGEKVVVGFNYTKPNEDNPNNKA